jgi:outer membrane protein assembly factor BamB
LRVAWRKTLGLSIEQPALAGSDGVLAIVTGARGEVIFLDADGEEKARVGAGAAAAGPATLSSDGTVVFTTSAGDAVGVRRASARPRFVTHLGGERNTRGAPLSLDDGGVVVTTATDLVALDAEGNVRSRVSLPEPAAAPLVASGERILAVTSSGAVYAWTPGREPVRVGSFGAPVDGGAALADADTLTAVIEGNHLVDLDLRRGARSTRAVATQGLYLGPPSVRTAPSGSLATLLAYTTTRAFVVSLDASGRETGRAPMAEVSQVALPDGGVAKLEAPAHTGPLVDARGAAAFAGPDGRVGVAQPDGAVELVGELICTKTPRSSGVAGLTALGRGAFAVTCESGAVARITGSDTDGASSSGAAR